MTQMDLLTTPKPESRAEGDSMDRLVRLPALSIRQPWAWLIAMGGKDIENRTWPTRFRGRFLIHAGKQMDNADTADAAVLAHGLGIKLPDSLHLRRGGIVGVAEIVDCVMESESPWFFGDYGFVIRNARTLPFHACKGSLGFFSVEYPEALLGEANGGRHLPPQENPNPKSDVDGG